MTRERGSTGLDLSQVTALVVDDALASRRLLQGMLDAFGVGRVVLAEDGAEAQNILRGGLAPDILITDYPMRRMDGLELTYWVRHRLRSPERLVPIIMVTARDDLADTIAARDAGVTEFLAKPVTVAQVYDRLVRVLGPSRPFIVADGFAGPDRRRLSTGRAGDERRRPPCGPAARPGTPVRPCEPTD